MKKAEQELAEIKSMMERSTRFLSLSGLSGVLAGIYALIGAGLGYYWIYFPNPPIGFRTNYVTDPEVLYKLIITGVIILILSVGTAFLLSKKRSKKLSQKTIWTPASKRFLQALLIPILVGGLFAIALVIRGYFVVIAPSTLIFYGLGLVQASQFTHGDIRQLGYGQLAIGLVSVFMPGYGLILWTLGFGVLHIIYGTIMHYNYER